MVEPVLPWATATIGFHGLHISARPTYTDMNAHEFDVVIIGSGPGGGAAAWALARQGVKILILEAGPAYDPFTDYHLHKASWEQHGFPRRARYRGRYSFGEMQPLETRWDSLRSWNHITGPRNKTKIRRGLRYLHVRGVGGTTLHFTGEAHRLNPASMRMRSRFGVAADWPIRYDDLEPYYDIAERVLGVSGLSVDPIRPRSQPFPLPAHAPSYTSQKIMSGTQKLGLQWTPNPVAVPSQSYDGRPPCNYCGNCNRGCPRTDKGSVDVTFIRKARATGNCTIWPESPVTRINAGPDDRVQSVDYVDAQGTPGRINARVLVVACGAIETPRLLLLAKNNNAPDGLANETGQVGKHFMETLYWFSSGLHPENLASYRGLPQDIICWDYNAPDSIPGVIGGCRFYPATAEQSFLGPINYATRVVKGWGHAHKQAMRELFGRVISIGAIGECLPNENSYIDLDLNKKDKLELPVARINTFLDDQRLRCLSFMASKCREILGAAGATEVFEEKGTYDAFISTHVFGTCRMGTSPEESVVNPDCRSHRWANLFVVDASVFPSSGGGEGPSLTIEALAIRAADKIREQLAAREI